MKCFSAYKRGGRQNGSQGNPACLSKCQWLLPSGVSVRGMHPAIRRESEIKDFRVWCTLASQSSLLLSAPSLAELLYGSWKSQLHRPWGFSVRWDETIQLNAGAWWIAWHEPAWRWSGWKIVVCLCGSQGWLQSWSGSMPCPWGILWGEEAKEISDSKDASVPKPASTNPWQLCLCYTGCFPWSWAWTVEDACGRASKTNKRLQMMYMEQLLRHTKDTLCQLSRCCWMGLLMRSKNTLGCLSFKQLFREVL